MTKSSGNSASIFIDWMGGEYVGVKSKAGQAPMQLILSSTGKSIPNEEVKEFEDEEIIEYFSTTLFPMLLAKDGKAFENIPAELMQNKEFAEEIELSKNVYLFKV